MNGSSQTMNGSSNGSRNASDLEQLTKKELQTMLAAALGGDAKEYNGNNKTLALVLSKIQLRPQEEEV